MMCVVRSVQLIEELRVQRLEQHTCRKPCLFTAIHSLLYLPKNFGVPGHVRFRYMFQQELVQVSIFHVFHNHAHGFFSSADSQNTNNVRVL